MAKATFNKKILFTSKQDLKFRKETNEMLQFEHSLSGVETGTLLKTEHKYIESFEMWCCRRMEKTSWTDSVKNEEVCVRVKEKRNILHEIKRRNANWIGHILRRYSVLKYVIEVTTEVTRRRGRRRKRLLGDLKEIKMLEFERRSNILHFLENSLW